jgi:hypothetical protein
MLGTTCEPLTNQRKDRFMADANHTLTDKQIQDAVFAVLRRWNDDRAWDRYTRESGPYDVSSLRAEVLEIIRAVLAITPVAELRRLIADDAYAMTFQTFGQYRTALLKTIDSAYKLKEKE